MALGNREVLKMIDLYNVEWVWLYPVKSWFGLRTEWKAKTCSTWKPSVMQVMI